MYWQFRGSYLTTWHNYCLLAIDTLIELADKVDALQLISESLKTVKIKSWEKATSLMEELICSYYYDKKVIKTKKEVYLRKIKIAKGLDPDAEDQKPQTAGCYIATAVYGSYDCPEVWTLRRYRDDDLGSNFFGRLFIKIYYAISPTLVKLFGKTKWFKKMWKKILDKKVEKLNDNGVDNTPYEDKKW